ncbi:MAG: hypothetical protein U0903_19425 [Planctomycetales bacterium]
MQDPRTTQPRTEPNGASPATPPADEVELEFDDFTPVKHRLDPPHVVAESFSNPPADDAHVERPDLLTQSFPSSASIDPFDTAPAAQLRTQATQISDYLKERQADLTQREERLLQQLTQFDQEQRKIRLWVTQYEEEFAEREELLDKREAACLELENISTRREQDLEQRLIEVERTKAGLQERDEQLALREQNFHQEMEQVRARLQEEWNADLQRHEQALTELQHRIQADRVNLEQIHAEHREMVEADRAELHAEITAARNQIQAELNDLQATREAQEEELRRERTLLESRIRFQWDHLEKSRQDFEAEQREFLIEKQYLLQRCQEERQQLTHHRDRLEDYRDLLEQRETSLQTSQESFAKAQQHWVDTTRTQQERREIELRHWEQEQERQRGEFRRQQEVLATHAENLEIRHHRLDELRTELEATHRQILETRLAVEESIGQLAQVLGQEGAQQRIDTARQAISEHYSKCLDSLLEQRRELESGRATFQQQIDEFRRERQAMADWVTDCDERLKLREADLNRRHEEFGVQERNWEKLQENWQQERTIAERLVRDLLRRLEDQTFQPQEAVKSPART